ncbi:MAG: DUF1549 domain-containing protein [Planctomycetia bacterium]|nr:DUF1549 domain-containing protein [Planctomycetia bacterium]
MWLKTWATVIVRVTLAVSIAVNARLGWAIDFAHDVVPLMKKYCGECHTGDAKQGGFSMNTREDLLAGGDSGTPGFVEGDAASSEIIARITSADPDSRMPSEGPPLPPEAIELFKQWIAEQAPWEEGFAFQRTTWEPPLRLRSIELPPEEEGRTNPVDRVVDGYWKAKGIARPPRADDRAFIRRVSLDLVGLLPDPERVEAFVADSASDKRARLVRGLLDDRFAYAEHWMTFWNDLLRNDYTGTGFITGGRRQITAWLHRSLVHNKPFDQFVRELIAPTDESRGFIEGIVWRGTVNASQTVPIQFAQNVGQTFLGINLKCASCHDSFVDRWTLKQTYDLAAIASAAPLELHRCDKATGTTATPAWLFEELGQVDPQAPPSRRLEQLAALMTTPDNGWLSRNLVNRLWHRLMGRGIVHPVDSLRLPPWSEDLLDTLAGDLVASKWDVKHVLATICTSETYGAATPAVAGQAQGTDYVFRGPLPRRMTAEQFTDAVWQLTNTAPPKTDAEVLRFEPPPGAAAVQPAATWIWSNDLAASPPGEKLTFRTTFELPADAVHGVIVFAADNEATVFINGKPTAKSADWTRPVMEIVTSDLRKGPNEIVVTAANGTAGGPAALRVELRVKTADGTTHTVATDDSWQWTAAQPDGRGTFKKGKEPTDWAPAAVVKTQSTWDAAMADFAAKLLYALAPDALPMVRAALVKGTALMAALGRPNRDQVVTSRPSDLTTLEAIQLANEQSLADEFSRGGAAILRDHGPAADAIASWLYAAALSRKPTPEEAAAARDLLGEKPTADSVADCLWAIVMLPEFQLIR